MEGWKSRAAYPTEGRRQGRELVVTGGKREDV